MTVNSSRIARILDQDNKSADTTLRAKSLQRAITGAVPTTLTAYEWEQWYAEHGVPEAHLTPATKRAAPWWRKWFS